MNPLRTLALTALVALATALAGCGSLACGPNNCSGCCDATGICQTSDAANCGAGGAACVTCPGIEVCSAAGICGFGGGNNNGGNNGGSNGNGASSGGSTSTVTGSTGTHGSSGSNGTTGTTGASSTSTGTTGSTSGLAICATCVNNSDCESGFCDLLNASGHEGFCDTASPCSSNAECGSVDCDPTGGGYCLCLGATTSTSGSTGQVTSGSTAASSTTGSTTASSTTGSSTSSTTGSTTGSTTSATSTTTGGSTTATSTTTGSSSSTTGTSGSSGTTGVADQCGVVPPAPIACSGTCNNGYTCVNGTCQLNGASGALQISLRWNTSDDFDLHVIEPGGCEINYAQLTCVGSLVLDANPGCSNPVGPNSVENVTYGTTPPSGTYTVVAHDYMTCTQTQPVPFEVVVRNGNASTTYCGTFNLADQESVSGVTTGKTVATFSYP